MSKQHDSSKSDSEFEDLQMAADYLKQVNDEIDSSPVTFDDLMEQNKTLSQKVDLLTNENTTMAQNINKLQQQTTQLQNQLKVTEKLFMQENQKCRQAQELIAKYKQAEEQNKKNEQSEQEKQQTQVTMQQIMAQNQKLLQEIAQIKKQTEQDLQFKESETEIFKEMINEKTKEVNELRQKLEACELELVSKKREEMLDSMNELDFVLSRDPSSYANDHQSGEPMSQSAQQNAKNSSEPWIMKQSLTKTLYASQMKVEKQDQSHVFELESQLLQATVKLSQLSQRLVMTEENLAQLEQKLNQVRQKLAEQTGITEKLQQEAGQIQEEHTKQVEFYTDQLSNVNELRTIQLEQMEIYKKKIGELSEQVKNLVQEKSKVEPLEKSLQQENGSQTTLENNEISNDQEKQQKDTLQVKSQLLIQKYQQELEKIKGELIETKNLSGELQNEKLSLKTMLQTFTANNKQYQVDLETVNRDLQGKDLTIAKLQKQINELKADHLQEIEQKNQVIFGLEKSLEERTQKLTQDNNFISVQKQLRENLLASTTKLQELQKLKNALDFNYADLSDNCKILQNQLIVAKNQFEKVQTEKDITLKENHRMKAIIQQADVYFNSQFDKMEHQSQQLKQTLKQVKQEFKQAKQTHLTKTKDLNQQITSLRSESNKLNQLVRKYENPRSNQERFELIKVWFRSKAWANEQKCMFMNWTEEFFRDYSQYYLSFAEEAMEYVQL